ncbi:MAG: molybdopterin-guanine dinucleotide biosynthesis protein B [Candidatus Thiodiazotropha sp. (ex Myrtea spinifera)]|nr:molybdopterin-guanine dinucleotide biosynthesis protein B [Candidatus Thiodiazotropha sp. (ex Myrtea spinifera)]MCU7830923.1 molybdopterin-guanine dinucleotide biosynthesis protein B [Candidatus Thiodiazotropha sp. (ex Myrtea sp. 'scaly one' KF741663)]
MIDYPLPLIGFSAFSGTGKTTLLKKLLPILSDRGLRIVMIKHAHHQFEIDHPRKDSYELRKAGAVKTLVASRRRMALVTEFGEDHPEPTLRETLAALDPDGVDLVLVEGFKREDFPKIELYRISLGKPLLCRQDPHIIAIASDTTLSDVPAELPRLNLNKPEDVAGFIQNYLHQFEGKKAS